MTPQTPAKGILLVNDWGSSMMYKAVCEWMCDNCDHTLDIEADDNSVSVIIYTKTSTNFWSKNRWSHIWKLLTKGYIESETSLIMSKQVALNYSATLTQAVQDVENFKKPRSKHCSKEQLPEAQGRRRQDPRS